MDKCLQYIEICDKDPQFIHAEDLQRAITERLSELKKRWEQETATILCLAKSYPTRTISLLTQKR
jgi:hypothetical protein